MVKPYMVCLVSNMEDLSFMGLPVSVGQGSLEVGIFVEFVVSSPRARSTYQMKNLQRNLQEPILTIAGRGQWRLQKSLV